jgi:hypothetical protein
LPAPSAGDEEPYARRREQLQTVAKALGYLVRGEGFRSSGGELDRKGDSIQLVADPSNRGCVLVSQGEPRERAGSPIDKQSHCFALRERFKGYEASRVR